jgi:hypothetical protein
VHAAAVTWVTSSPTAAARGRATLPQLGLALPRSFHWSECADFLSVPGRNRGRGRGKLSRRGYEDRCEAHRDIVIQTTVLRRQSLAQT